MRKFKVSKVSNLEGGNITESHYIEQELELIPILSQSFLICEELFRCIEHKQGLIRLINKMVLLEMKEIY